MEGTKGVAEGTEECEGKNCWHVADDVSRRDSQMDDDTQWYREIHLRCA